MLTQRELDLIELEVDSELEELLTEFEDELAGERAEYGVTLNDFMPKQDGV